VLVAAIICMINFKKIITTIHEEQLKTFCSMTDFRENGLKNLPTKQRGLYWLWTDLTMVQLAKEAKPHENKEVPISSLLAQRDELQHVGRYYNEKNFRVVYNGVGGYKKTKSFGLRERINQEINANGPTVGTLNILKNSTVGNWGVSYFNFDEENNKELIPLLNFDDAYNTYAKDLEMIWRLEHGHPILCRH
jgi:hypothetical protein